MEKHCYLNWEKVVEVLTKQFGFDYTGIGDNAEECFYKRNGNIEERVFVHMFHCSYSKTHRINYPSLDWNRITEKTWPGYPKQDKTDRDRQDSFFALCNYLSENSININAPGSIRSKLNHPVYAFEGARSHLYDWADPEIYYNGEMKLGKELFNIQHYDDGRAFFRKDELVEVLRKHGIKVKWPI